jgi:hypothetical protein
VLVARGGDQHDRACVAGTFEGVEHVLEVGMAAQQVMPRLRLDEADFVVAVGHEFQRDDADPHRDQDQCDYVRGGIDLNVRGQPVALREVEHLPPSRRTPAGRQHGLPAVFKAHGHGFGCGRLRGTNRAGGGETLDPRHDCVRFRHDSLLDE